MPSLTSYHELGLLEHKRIITFYVRYSLYVIILTGDTRLHAMPSLTSYHELGLLEHNRIVTFHVDMYCMLFLQVILDYMQCAFFN